LQPPSRNLKKIVSNVGVPGSKNPSAGQTGERIKTPACLTAQKCVALRKMLVSRQERENANNLVKFKTKLKYWNFPVCASRGASAQSGWTTSVDLMDGPIPTGACFSAPGRNVLTTTPQESMSASPLDDATEEGLRSQDKLVYLPFNTLFNLLDFT